MNETKSGIKFVKIDSGAGYICNQHNVNKKELQVYI